METKSPIFTNEYELTKELYKEASTHIAKAANILFILYAIIALPISILIKSWIACAVVLAAIICSTFLLIYQTKRVNNIIKQSGDKWANNMSPVVRVEIFDDKIIYTSTAGEHVATKEQSYKDVKRVRISKHFILLLVIKSKQEKYIIGIKRGTSDEKDILQFVKNKKNKK